MKVFISSVFKRLEAIRDELIRKLLTAGDKPIAMEVFGARPEAPIETCLSELRASDLAIVIIGPRYGSMVPGTTVSYTHNELLEAVKAGIPVYAFKLRADPEVAAEELKALERFERDAGAALTWETTSEERLVADAVAAVLRHVRTHGEGGSLFRVFQPPGPYFKPQLNPQAPFHLAHSFLGRERELAELVRHAEQGVGVRILTAEGGAGKTRLLREVAEKVDSNRVTVRFVAPDAPWTAETLRELPHGPVCIVIDDAHRRDDLESLTAACIQVNPECRFIVASRPGGSEQVQSALRGVPGGGGENADLRLARLGNADAIALASASLGKGLEHLAGNLVKRSDGNPLLITVGGRAVARNEIHPELLERTDESFRRAALDRLVTEVGADGASGPALLRTLRILAAVGPLRLDDEKASATLAEFQNISPSEFSDRLSRLEQHHVLQRRGRTVRVSPDVLADHLLSVAGIAPDGRPTKFVDELIDTLGVVHLPNLLANVSELEWRSEAAGARVPVSDVLWNRLRSELEAGSHRQRADLVPVLRRAAVFSPSRALEVALWLAQQDEASRDELAEQVGLPDNPERLQSALTELIGFVGQHPAHTSQCVRWLANRAAADTRNTGPHPDHPVRLLQDLAAFRGGQPVSVPRSAIAELRLLLDRPDRPRPMRWLASVFAKAIEREGEYQRSTARAVTLSAFSLFRDLPRIAPIREGVMEALERLASGDDPVEAVSAVIALFRTLHLPEGSFGRAISAEEEAAWIPEARNGIERLRRVYDRSPHDAVRLLIRRTLSEWPEGSWEQLEPEIRALAEQLPTIRQQGLYDVLQGERWGVGEYEAEQQRFVDAARVIAADLWGRHPDDPRTIVGEVQAAARTLESVLGEQAARGAYGLMSALAEGRPEAAKELVLTIILTRAEELAEGASAVLYRRQADPDRAVEREVYEAAAACPSQRIRRRFASAFRSLFARRMIVRDDLELAGLFRGDPDPWTRVLALNALRYAPEALVTRAMEILLSFDLTDDPRCVDEAVGIFDDGRFGLRTELLADEHIDAILARIAPVRSMSRGTHHIVSFLGIAGVRRPRRVLEMLLDRIARAATREDNVERFQPVPFASDHALVRSVGDSQEGLDLVQLAARRCVGNEYVHRFWGPHLVHMIATPEVACKVADTLARSHAREDVEAAAAMLKEFEHSLIFDRHELVATILQRAAREGEETHKAVTSSLVALASSGVYSGSPGLPMPRHVSDEKLAAALAEKYQDDEPVHQFYRSLRQWAQQSMQHHKEMWEEELAEWEEEP